MGITRFNAEAPVRSVLVDRTLTVTMRWLQWFQRVGDRISATSIVDAAYDPPSLGAGATVTVNVTFPGVRPKDLVKGVSFDPMTAGGVASAAIRFLANVTAADTVSVTLLNVSGGAVDLDAGTLRIEVERVE